MRVAAVDVGTNAVRLLVADVVDGSLEEVTRRATITRLGQDVDRTGAFAANAVSRTLDVLTDYGTAMEDLGVDRRHIIATSAARDAANSADFLEAAAIAAGARPEVIDGDAEARLSFRGATSRRDAAGIVLVIDVGGGSTEFVAGESEPVYAASVDVGSVRLTERCLQSLPAGRAAVAGAREHAAELLAARLELLAADAVVGVGGTYTSLCAVNLGLAEYERDTVDGSRLGLDELAALVDRLGALSLDEIAAIPTMEPGRAPVILGGAIVAEQALAATGAAALTVSESDILDGVALSLAAADS